MCDPCDCGQPRPEIVVKCTIAERQEAVLEAVRRMHTLKIAFNSALIEVETTANALQMALDLEATDEAT